MSHQDDLKHQAKWIAANLTKDNKNLIADAQTKPEKVRLILLETQVAAICKDRAPELNKAIEKGECPSHAFSDFRTQQKRKEIAQLVIAELQEPAS